MSNETNILLALDRTSVLIDLMHETLGFWDEDFPEEVQEIHPGVRSKRSLICLSTASQALCELYQALGEDLYYAEEKSSNQ